MAIFDAAKSSPAPGLVISDDGTSISTPTTPYSSGLSTLGVSTGKRYFEATVLSLGGTSAVSVGLATPAVNKANIAGNDNVSVGYATYGTQIRFNGGAVGVDIGASSNGMVIAVAVDFDKLNVWIRGPNGKWNGTATDDPATNTGGLNAAPFYPGLLTTLLGNTLYADISVYDNSAASLNVGDTAFVGPMPAGFVGFAAAAAVTPTPTPTASNNYLWAIT